MTAIQLPHTIADKVHLPPMPKSTLFTQIVCKDTGDKTNKIELFGGDGKPLGTVGKFCSTSGGIFEGTSNIALGPYTVFHAQTPFGLCTYKDWAWTLQPRMGPTQR